MLVWTMSQLLAASRIAHALWTVSFETFREFTFDGPMVLGIHPTHFRADLRFPVRVDDNLVAQLVQAFGEVGDK